MVLIRWTAWAALLIATATGATAQTTASRPERPSRALFGSGVGDVSQLLTASASLGGGFDSSLASDARGNRGVSSTDFDSSGDGIVTGLRAALGYSLSTEDASVVAAAETAPRYYPSLHDRIFRRDMAVVRGTLNLPLSIVAMGSAGYVPYSVLSLARGGTDVDDTELPDTDFPVSLHHYVTWKAGLSTSHRLSRRAWITADTTYSTRRLGVDGRQFRTAAGGGRLRYQVGVNTFLKAGYHYADAQYSDELSYARHVIDLGADFSRDLSIARRTTFSFSTGTSMITYPVDADQPAGRGARNRFRLSGAAQLRHEMGRTWTASLGYQRGVQFLEAWPDPLLSDSVTAKVDGSVSRRVQFSASARASTGRNARLADENGFNLYHGAATLTYAFNRHVNVGLLMTTYHHRFGEQVTLPPGFGPWFDRHRVIAQISVWAPLLSRSRRVNATR
jgi:hypothetical protein